jgi:hypothetical protein
MRKRTKPSPEFDNFTAFMDKLAQVPHSELRAELDAEKALKQTSERQANDRVKREAQKHLRSGGNEGVHFLRKKADNPVVQVANEVFKKAARRKVN